jgi:hypothetical protein
MVGHGRYGHQLPPAKRCSLLKLNEEDLGLLYIDPNRLATQLLLCVLITQPRSPYLLCSSNFTGPSVGTFCFSTVFAGSV